MSSDVAGGWGPLAAKAQELLDAHHAPDPLVLPNVWDVASARIVEQAGFPVVATSSRAIAGVLGLGDDDSSDPDTVFGWAGRIAGAVACPVTVDLEAGYRLRPADLVERLLSVGAVGCNLEDTDHHGNSVLLDAGEQAAFVAEVRAAGDAAGVHVVINARIDSFIRHAGDETQQLEEAVRRGRSYLEAGADCVYPIALGDRVRITQFVSSMPGPVNLVARRGGLGVGELAALGAHRISLASGLFEVAYGQLRAALRRLEADPGWDQHIDL